MAAEAFAAPYICARCLLWFTHTSPSPIALVWCEGLVYFFDGRDHQEGVGLAYTVTWFATSASITTTRLRVTDVPPPWVPVGDQVLITAAAHA